MVEKAKVEVRGEEKAESKSSNFLRYMSNPQAFTLKKWMYEILGQSYTKHDTTLDRVASSFVTEQDLKDFGSLITEIYEIAYRRAVDDYREQVEKMGFKVNVVPSAED